MAILSMLIALQIASCVTEEELEILSALYSSIGDQLGLIGAAGCK
ncbi:MAG TPA: hypothetical protein PKX46_07090 [Clostridia bacterium]|nr:hypothetical protein [Clostridia bacterium]HOR13677.1 hypothetical protein [Clostridia bacterium]